MSTFGNLWWNIKSHCAAITLPQLASLEIYQLIQCCPVERVLNLKFTAEIS
ncbi:hypothetical protein PGT21_004352 [Puccinia graminis f. sp. tritici]|uniref:Uncharacterized protein n=1 Tax=Puccinia graminis f. sp. tritici TaxID=56615 RepID=A0A5B0QZN5_PUCGR|nr:hypothetical protein PGT21_004352 [Puccinia graminis f. sp. tritici]